MRLSEATRRWPFLGVEGGVGRRLKAKPTKPETRHQQQRHKLISKTNLIDNFSCESPAFVAIKMRFCFVGKSNIGKTERGFGENRKQNVVLRNKNFNINFLEKFHFVSFFTILDPPWKHWFPLDIVFGDQVTEHPKPSET